MNRKDILTVVAEALKKEYPEATVTSGDRGVTIAPDVNSYRGAFTVAVVPTSAALGGTRRRKK